MSQQQDPDCSFLKAYSALSLINNDFKSNIQSNQLLLLNKERADLINTVGAGLDKLQEEMKQLVLLSQSTRDYDC